jgi:hypothetical protein
MAAVIGIEEIGASDMGPVVFEDESGGGQGN